MRRATLTAAVFLFLHLLYAKADAKRHPRTSEASRERGEGEEGVSLQVRVVNECPLNVKLRCQSVLTDHADRFMAPSEAFRFKFRHYEMGNRHFWCDVYALNRFNETFDVYGGTRNERRGNLTWLVRPDGLYDEDHIRWMSFSSWMHSPSIYLAPYTASL